jgi:hypothetical protein
MVVLGRQRATLYISDFMTASFAAVYAGVRRYCSRLMYRIESGMAGILQELLMFVESHNFCPSFLREGERYTTDGD